MNKIELNPSVVLIEYMNRVTTAGKNLGFYLLNDKTNTADIVYNKINNKTPDTVLIIDYFTNDLISKFPNAKIKIAFTEERVHNLNDITKEAIKDRINRYYKYFANRQVDIIYLEEKGIDKEMKFDLVIANPPYGKIGTNITYKIIQDVDFKEYVNLLPAGDYLKGGYSDIQNYISDIENLPHDAFRDASVTAAMAKISKTKVNTLTSPDYLTVMSSPKSLMTKYYLESVNRVKKQNVEFMGFKGKNLANSPKVDILKNGRVVAYDTRVADHHHLAYNKNKEYLFNRGLITAEEICKAGGCFHIAIFNSISEKKNYLDFIYSEEGFKFISLIFSKITPQNGITKYFIIPNVDWSKPQTVQSILKEYNYTDEEITEVKNELKKPEYGYFNVSDSEALKRVREIEIPRYQAKQSTDETNRSTEE